METCLYGKTELLQTWKMLPESDLPGCGQWGRPHVNTGESYPIIQEALSGSRESHRRLETCLYQISTCWSVQIQQVPTWTFQRSHGHIPYTWCKSVGSKSGMHLAPWRSWPMKIAGAAVSAGPLKCCGDKLPPPSHGGVSGLLPERGVSKMK